MAVCVEGAVGERVRVGVFDGVDVRVKVAVGVSVDVEVNVALGVEPFSGIVYRITNFGRWLEVPESEVL